MSSAYDNLITGNVQLDDDTLMELQSQVGTYYNHAIGYHEGELGVKARMGWEYYYGTLPEPVTKGSSKWVDRSVWEAVNGTLQELISVFTSSENAVKFAPMHSQDANAAMAATKMVNKILLRDNEGYNVLHDAFKECLVARNSFIKRYWKTDIQTYTETFEELNQDEIDILIESIKGNIIEFSAEEIVGDGIDHKQMVSDVVDGVLEGKDVKIDPKKYKTGDQKTYKEELDNDNDLPSYDPDEEGGSNGKPDSNEQMKGMPGENNQPVKNQPPMQAGAPQGANMADSSPIDEPEAPESDSKPSKPAPKGSIPLPLQKGAMSFSDAPEGKEKEEVKLFNGYVTYEVESEGVKVEYVPFEEVIVEPTARSLKDANYIGHRVRKTKDELINMGFNMELVQELNPASSDIEAGVIANVRVNNLNPLNISDVLSVGDPKADKLWLHENYIKTSLLNGRMEILQVFTINQQVLEVNRVNEFPFETMTPFPIPGSLWGESVFDITKDVQDLTTTLVRGMIDNIMNANFRRYEAIKGQYDRESLLNNRPGAVIEVMSQGAVTPFPYHQLPQGIDMILEYINGKKEERTGVSKVGQGLDPNVFKNDNAQGTVQMVMSAAQNRLRMVARNIAQRGMMTLLGSIYNLVRQNAKQPIIVETAKGMISLDPRKLPPRSELIVSVAVGDGERKERATALQSLMMAVTQNPNMQKFMQPENAYHMAREMFESMGVFDVENYLTPLDQIPPPQPDPMQQLQIQQMQEQIKQIGVQTQKLISDATSESKKSEFEQQKAADEMQLRLQESRSLQDMNADKMSIEERKLALEERRIQLESDKIELKRQEMLVEAQIEARQSRPVSIGR